MKTNFRNILRYVFLGILGVVLLVSAFYLLILIDKNNENKRKEYYIRVNHSQNGVTFVNYEVDVYRIDFNKLDEGVDYTTIESEVYYFVNENSRVYVLATKYEVTIYIYNNRLYIRTYDLEYVTIRNTNQVVIDLRE